MTMRARKYWRDALGRAWWRGAAWAVLGGALALCSCVGTRPSEFAPPLELPSSFSDSGDSAPSARWWEEFGDEDLETLVERALDDNLDLRAAVDRLAQALATARQQGAALWPSLDGSASASRTARRTEIPPQGGDTEYSSQFRVGLNAGYVVDVWGKMRAARSSAHFAASASAYDAEATRIALAAQVTGTWYRFVETRLQLDVLARQVASNENSLELVEMRFRKGQVPATDVLRQRQLVESVRADRATVEGTLASLEHQLATLTGRAPGTIQLPADVELPAVPPLPRTGTPARWLRRRPDVQAAHMRVLSRDRSVAVALAERYPALSLTGTAESAVPSLSELLDQWAVSVAGTLSAPIFAGGRRDAEVARTRGALSESVHQYGQAVLNGLREVEDALSRETAQQRTITGLERQLDLAEETLGQLQTKYRNGTVSFIEVLSAQQSFQQLQRRLLTARRILIERRIDLYAALGGAFSGTPTEAPGLHPLRQGVQKP